MSEDDKSPYFQNDQRPVISVVYPVWGKPGWLIWNWDASSWDHITTEQRTLIKTAETAFYADAPPMDKQDPINI